jgi:glyoxylase-like metal-dependent hydrolase (beta-lactamase superfamily II)
LTEVIRATKFGEVTRFDSARTILGRGVYWATAYLVAGLMIDTGCAHSASELVERLEGEQLAQIVNTHSHEDHIGANGLLQQRQPGIKIYAHPSALPVLADPRSTQPLQLYRRVMWGWPQPSAAQPAQNGDVIETGRWRFEVIYTPGHSPDHLCLYERERGWLFSGDLFVGGQDRALRVDNNIWQILSTLKLVAGLPIARLFPGCARVRENPAQELADKIAYLEEIGGQVLALHNKGFSPGKITQSLFGGPMWIELVTAGHFSRLNLVNSFIHNKP